VQELHSARPVFVKQQVVQSAARKATSCPKRDL